MIGLQSSALQLVEPVNPGSTVILPEDDHNAAKKPKKKVLFIGGSLNQTRILHKISSAMPGYDHFFTPFYADGLIHSMARAGLLTFTILGGHHRKETLEYIRAQNLNLDHRGNSHDYDLVITGTDLIIQNNIRDKPIVLVQEGMMDRAGWVLTLVKTLHLPRWMANTAATGLSDAYKVFCVASKGNRDLFIQRGVKPEKIKVTGIPYFDDVDQHLKKIDSHDDYILVATSNGRETFKTDRRKQFLSFTRNIANNEKKKLIFKLHPNEDAERASREILAIFPGAAIIQKGDIAPLIARSSLMISEYSSVILLALAMNKEVRCECNLEEIKQLLPVQNGGESARKIARICQRIIEDNTTNHQSESSPLRARRQGRQGIEWLPLK